MAERAEGKTQTARDNQMQGLQAQRNEELRGKCVDYNFRGYGQR